MPIQELTGLKGLPGLNRQVNNSNLSDAEKALHNIARISKKNTNAFLAATNEPAVKPIGLELEQAGYGESSYDKGVLYSQLDNLQDVRANAQPWYSQLINGVLKGVATAGTTFLDGTVGLLYGIGSAFANGDPNELYNNDMSKALRTFTSEMEKILPNYRTRDEQENPWALRNIFSMNTIADDFLKNIGFTVGALYSGNAYLGALKALGGAKLSGLAAKTIGSVISGVNEGRIEAGHVYDDMLSTETDAIKAESNTLYEKIMSDPTTTSAEKRELVQALDKRTQSTLANAKERAESAAMNDLIFNSLYLPFTDAYAYGKIYARGFNTKSQLRKRAKEGVSEAVENSGKMVDNIAAQEAKKETLGNRIIKKGKEYIYDPVSRKKAALRGLKTGLSEGAEEMNQAFFSSLSSNMSQPDSPDAYYKALTDDDYKIKTKDFLTSMSEALADSWGNSETYKEGLVGFLTGILGTPTFGRVQNSDAFTYLGRGRRFGLTGGILGEMRLSNELNQQAENAVNQMNKLVDKVKNSERFFTRSQAFNNTMDGYSEEGNKFEFENAKDNDIYNMIDAFSRTGRIDDLRDLVNQDFDNISDEELDEIVKRTTINDSSFNVGEDGTPLYHSTEQRNVDSQNSWANEDGSSMANSEKGRAEMRKKLNDNKKRILKDIDSYIDSLAKVRAISNNSLDEDQTAELAWLHWKIKKFNDRFSSVKEDSEELFSQMKKGLQQRLDELNDSIDPELDESSLGDDESYDLVKQGIAERKSVEALLKYVDFLSKARNALDLGQRINLNQELQKHLTETFNVGGKIEGTPFYHKIGGNALNGLTVDAIKSAYDLFGDKLGMTSDDFIDAMKRLSDVGKMASAAITFNERFKEFSSDPMKLIQNREKIDKQENKVNKAKNINKVKDSISTMSVSDIVNQLNSGDLSEEDLDSIYPKEDQDVPVKKGEELTAAQKVKKAKEIRKKAQDVKGQIEKQVADGKIDRAVADDVEKLLGKNLENAESIDELLDSKSLAFQDPTSLMTEEDMANIDQVPSVGNELEDRLLKAAEALEEAIANAGLAEDALQDLPDNIDDVVAKAEAEPEPKETGHDKTPTPDGVNPPPSNPYADNGGKKEKPEKTQAQSNQELAKEDLSEAVDLDTLGDNVSRAINALATLYDAIDDLKKVNLPAKEIAKLIAQKSTNYSILKAILDPINKNLVGTLLQGKIGEPLQKETKSSEEVNKTGDPENIPTPALDSIDTLNSDINSSLKESIPNNDETIRTPDGKLGYWKPTLTETDRRASRGDFTPFSEKAQKSSGYSEAQKKRMKVVGDFLLKKEVFKRVDSGKVQAGSTIKFVVYPKINKDAEDFVIFMTDEDGNILGDVMSLKDSVVDNQVGLKQFINEAQEEYNKAIKDKNIDDNDESVVIELPWTSNIRQLLIGRPNYTADNDRHSLNEIFGEGKFDLGIRVANDTIRTNSRGKQGDKDEHEKGILIPRTYVPGKPYLLLPTGSQQDGKRLYAVPFVMSRYNSSNRDSMLGRAIRETISKAITLKGQEASKTITREINELLSANFIGVLRFNNSNGVKITIETLDGKKKEKTFYVNDKDFVNKVEDFLSNLPFRIAKKYINSTYNLDGTSVRYNAMIGELANTNLPVGDARVIGNWFSVNPVGKDGKITKAAIIKTTEQAAPASVRSDVSFKGTSYSVEKSSMTVFKDGKEYTESDVNLIRAHAVGVMNKYDMSKPYNTDYGYYDPVKNKFITKPTEEKKEAPKPIAKNPNDDIIHITNTSNGLSHVGELQEWSQKTSDVRTEPDGWGSKDGLTYYKKTIPGRTNDNITIWFNGTFNPTVFTEERLNNIASNIDSMIEKGSTTDDLSDFIVGIIRAYGRENLSNTNTFVEQSSNNTNIKIDENKKKSYMESILKNTKYAWQAEELKHITDNLESFPSFASAFDYMIKKGIELGIDKNDTSYDKVNNYLLLLYNKPLPDNIAVIVESTEPEEGESTTKSEGENNEVQPPTWLSSSPAINQHIWNALTNEQKERFSKLISAKQKSIMKKLEQKFNKNANKFRDGTNVDTLFRKTTNDLGVEVWDERKERRWLAKVLPELNRDERLKVVNGLIKVADTGGDAYGMFQRGLITISDRAASGTLYHEAFHSVIHTLLNDDEINKIFEAAYNKWGNIGLVGLEENLAEDFRRYVQAEERPFTGKIIRIWRTLKHLVQSLNKKKYAVDRLFYAINRGKLKNRVQHSSRAVRYDINAREKSEIKARALANGTYMKAPNGKDTKLTEEQWLTVRTKAFKEWFGDWENNPNSASKVIDDDGENATFEPLVVYHGTHAGEKFNTFRIPTHIMGEKTGVFFTSDQEYAKQFSPITPLFETFLNIRNPKTGVSLDRDEVVKEKVYNAMENHGLTIDGLIGHDKYESGLSLSKGTEYVVFSPNQIKSAIDNIGTFSKTDNNIYHRLVEDEQNQVEQGIRNFLDNLGITVEDMSNYNGEISLYDATRKVINAKSPEDITDGVGEAVAFLCQWQPEFRDIVSLKLAMTDSTFAKNMRRMMKKGKEFEIKDFVLSNPKTPKERRDFYGSAEMQSIREVVIKEVGKDIANELRKLYDPNYKEDGKPNTITSKIRHLIEMLFDLLKNPYTRIRLERAANFSKNAAQSISKGDVSFVIRDFIKPGNGSEESRQSSLVDVRDAFVKYPREEKIISDLNEYNIALAGSTSISLAGSVYRPAENPFHDLDFQAFGKSKEDLDNIINTLFPNNEYKWAIKNKYKEGHLCHTYLILDRPFKTREVKFGKDSYVEITDANTGEVLGRHIKAELMLKDGVFGKMLDFFVTENKEEGNKLLKEHPSITYTIHDKQYLVSDEYFAMEAKATWTREKDVWDLARFKQFKDRNIDTFREELMQYNSDKFMYSNLSQEDKDYLKERDISMDKYNKMTAEEKEILFRCKY